MSRETDSSNPAGNEPGEPKTETTLTTRIRINIPGSRPIPPVVMRKPVSEEEVRAEEGAPAPDAAGPPTPPSGTAAPEAGAGGRETSSWFAPRKPPSGPPPLDEQQAPAAGPVSPQQTPPGGTDTAQLPGFPAGERSAQGQPSPAQAPPPQSPQPPPHGRPAGPTTGATGDMPLLPPEFTVDGAGQQPPGPPSVLAPPPGARFDTYGGSAPHGTPQLNDAHDAHDAHDPHRPGGEGPRSDAPRPGVGDTAPGGIPAVSGAGEAAPDPFAESAPPTPPASNQAPAASRPPARKGRSKLTLVGVVAVGVLGIAYGAGLLMNHADVPNGTTVLGVDIGGTTKAEAVASLERRIGDRATEPLTLDVGGTPHELKPSVAGLSFDAETTVAGAAGREYNPIAVIGSLVGGEHPAEPVFTVDEEKLRAALAELGGGEGGAQDGMIRFENGEPVVVEGRARQAVDPEQAAETVEAAYRERAATGENAVIELSVGEQTPQVTDAEFERAIQEFGEPAMSGLVTVRAGTAEISFSPERSLPKFLSMRPTPDGTLVDHYDLEALEELYGSTFDGVLVTRGDGSSTPVTPEDVAGVLRTALLETDPAQRVGVIELDGQ
ncbi:hypothetical protein [Streptomyces sp. GSL17-111]|uniref:hypothetical protein n=1 Tax=Streptomyces sp. GSL17-111 TaxID=3121596 RepID=UPI0030F415B8